MEIIVARGEGEPGDYCRPWSAQDSSHRALDYLQQTFPTYWIHHQCAPAPCERFFRVGRRVRGARHLLWHKRVHSVDL